VAVATSPETVAYLVGCLYRHAIELQLKEMISEGDNFRQKEARSA
jgi:hypothetical protein